MKSINVTLSNIEYSAEWLLNNFGEKKIFAFFGKMGIGKTTIIKAICQKLGAQDTITSPSFALVNEYYTQNQDVIYHFDLYRIQTLEEFFDLGYEDYFFSGATIFIEWAEYVKQVLPEDTVEVYITENADASRRLDVYNIFEKV